MNSVVHGRPPGNTFEDLIRQVESLRQSIEQQEERDKAALAELPPERHQSAGNLLHYLALRSRDLRPLQDRLARLGLSSLGRMEPQVLPTVNAVLHNLYLLSGQKPSGPGMQDVYKAFNKVVDQLELNTTALLGEYPRNRRVHIIVTMPEEAADDYLMVHQLLKSGMNCMRINCAKDDPTVWSRMIEHLHHARQATGLSCRVLMDMSGPKLRLGLMEPMQAVTKIRPVRAKDGPVVRPARIWLAPVGEGFSEMPTADASLGLDPDWLAGVKAGDRVRFRDNRGARRCWRIREADAKGCWAEAKKTAYLANGTVLQLQHKNGKDGQETTVDSLVPRESVSLIRTGDILFMSLNDELGKPAFHDSNGELLNPARVSLTIPEVYRDVRLGEPVCFDDGRISGIIEKREATQLQIRITHTQNPVEKLEGRRGVNLPDTDLNLPTLTEKDHQDLEFAARNADMVGLSFTNCPDDVRVLYQHLEKLGREDIGVVLKIETKRGFSNLPAILLEALKFSACGIMIARGDLAVECGFERLSEIQEEILWVCESAHVPVIWATQVLEGLTKGGHATRAEVTDAAMSQAAEAVMLNKGPYLIEAVEMLDDILQRMQGHHRKKHSVMRELQLASTFHSTRS
jgi:pyruvate kinase